MASEPGRNLVWEGRIPVCFSLHPDEIREGHRRDIGPEACYSVICAVYGRRVKWLHVDDMSTLSTKMIIPRLSYFSLHLERIDNQFKRIAGANIQDIPWLECNGEPLKWQYPVGVLYDMTIRTPEELPWKIHIRYKDFPKDKILYFDRKEAVKAHFVSRLKEADFLKHKGEAMNALKEEEEENLWNGLLKDDFQLFWSTNQKLMFNIRGEQECFKYFPFFLYLDGGSVLQRLMPTVQMIKANDDPDCDVYSEQDYTLRHLLEKYYIDALSEGYQVRVHGITIPMETPLQWMSENLCYADNFVHIVILKQPQ